MNKEILILGIGNILLRDEGAGIAVVNSLQKQNLPDNVEVIDGGTAGFDLLDIIADRKAIILIDAIDAGYPPGTVVRFVADDLKASKNPQLSVHNIDFAQTLYLAGLLGCAPQKVIIFGIQPGSVEPGLNLTELVAGRIFQIAALVREELEVLLPTIS